jgi:hypothetical protein
MTAAEDSRLMRDELDGERIRRCATLRRATYRSRSHAIIAMLICGVAAIQSLNFARSAVGWSAAAFIACGTICIVGALLFFVKARDLHRRCAALKPEQENSAPDFSSLSDGSQRWKSLNEIH